MDLATALRAKNARMTQPRQAVWTVLSEADRHLSAQEIAERVSRLDSGVNVSSVYRTLALFAELDLVRESRLGDEGSTWELSHVDSVIHLVCTDCGAVRHHDASLVETLRRQLAQQAGFTAIEIDVRASGRCGDCG